MASSKLYRLSVKKQKLGSMQYLQSAYSLIALFTISVLSILSMFRNSTIELSRGRACHAKKVLKSLTAVPLHSLQLLGEVDDDVVVIAKP